MIENRELIVLVASELRLEEYRNRFREGLVPDEVPYGAVDIPGSWRIRALGGGKSRSLSARASRLSQRFLAFDVMQTLRHLKTLRSASHVYCHSEVEYLGAALIFRLFNARTPMLIGQTIWLFEEWHRHPKWRRKIMSWALRRVDLFIANARPNAELGAKLLPGAIHRTVPFGVSSLFSAETGPGVPDHSRILAVGNDRSRDWATLLASAATLPDKIRLRIATSRSPAPNRSDVEVRPTKTVNELVQLYRDCAVTVVTTYPNAHASGITTLLEVAAAGGAAVATRAGGLDEYFDDDEVLFVPPENPEALAVAIQSLTSDAAERARRSGRLARAFVNKEYTNDAYWRRVTDTIMDLEREPAQTQALATADELESSRERSDIRAPR